MKKETPGTRGSRYSAAKRAAAAGIAADMLLSSLKMITGVLGGSIALVADGIHSMGDIGSSAAVFFGLRAASRPGDATHPYGHGKAESLVSNNIAVLLILASLAVAARSAESFFKEAPPAPPSIAALWVAAASALVKELMYKYKIRLGGRLKSTSLVADAWHHRSDAFSSVAVVLGIGLSIYGPEGFGFLERAAALFVSCMIAVMGVKIYRKSSAELMDASPEGEMMDHVRDFAGRVPGVKRVETLVGRKSGLDYLMDIHIEVDPGLDVSRSHEIAEDVKTRIIESIPEVKSVLVHIEPHR